MHFSSKTSKIGNENKEFFQTNRMVHLALKSVQPFRSYVHSKPKKKNPAMLVGFFGKNDDFVKILKKSQKQNNFYKNGAEKPKYG